MTDIRKTTEERDAENRKWEAREKEYIEKARETLQTIERAHGRRLKSSVVTFGCQMNARDSEKLRGSLAAAGFEDTENELARSGKMRTSMCTAASAAWSA